MTGRRANPLDSSRRFGGWLLVACAALLPVTAVSLVFSVPADDDGLGAGTLGMIGLFIFMPLALWQVIIAAYVLRSRIYTSRTRRWGVTLALLTAVPVIVTSLQVSDITSQHRGWLIALAIVLSSCAIVAVVLLLRSRADVNKPLIKPVQNDKLRLIGATLLLVCGVLSLLCLFIELGNAPADDDGMYAGFTLIVGFVSFIPVGIFCLVMSSALFALPRGPMTTKRSLGIVAGLSTLWVTYNNYGWITSGDRQPMMGLHIPVAIVLFICGVAAIVVLGMYNGEKWAPPAVEQQETVEA